LISPRSHGVAAPVPGRTWQPSAEKTVSHKPRLSTGAKDRRYGPPTNSETPRIDDSNKYNKVTRGYVRRPVNHSKKQYAKKQKGETVSVNYCESSFSLLKRGIVGSFHHVSKKHLGRYMAEFDFKWNTRKDTDGKRTVEGLKKATGKRLTYKPLVAQNKPTS
jgi:ISXO2-like transposase domain